MTARRKWRRARPRTIDPARTAMIYGRDKLSNDARAAMIEWRATLSLQQRRSLGRLPRR